MRGRIGMGRGGGRLVVVAAALFGALLVPCVSASAKTDAELTLNVKTVGSPGTALSPSSAYALATQAPVAPGEARDAISIASATPSVCSILGYVWGPGEELPPEREMEAQVWVYGDGTCTIVASVKATSTTEAAEVSKSFTAGGPPIPQAPVQPTLPEISLGAAPNTPSATYLGGSPLSIEAKSTRPGLTVSSSTPAVCTVSPSQTNHLTVVVDLIATGTCTLSAGLPKTAEHDAVAVTKSILIAKVSFTSTPPHSAVAGGSYEVMTSSAPGLFVQLGLEGSGACTFTKPRLEQSLPPRPHSEPGPHGPDAPATVYFLRAGTCTITAGGFSASERVSQSFSVAPGPPEQITFTSAAPSDAVIGGAYSPTVRSSLGWPVAFSIATPTVCKTELGSSVSLSETINGVHLPSSAVHFLAAGTCTIDVRPIESSPGEALEARQSFIVRAPTSTSAPSGTGRTPSGLKLIGAEKPQVLCTAKASKCATLIIHTYASGGPSRHPDVRTPTSFKVWLGKLGPHGEVLSSLSTYKRRLRVTPGRYELQKAHKKIVVVRAGKTREVTVFLAEH